MTILLLLLCIASAELVAQDASEQLERTFPGRGLAGSAEPRLPVWLRAVRAGSASDRARLRAEMIAAGSARVPELVAALREDRSPVRQRQILLVLLELVDPRSRAVVLELVSGRRRGDASTASLVLGRLGGEGAEVALRHAAVSPRRRTRELAILGLGRLGDPRAVSYLRSRLPGARSFERRVILLALAMAGGLEAKALKGMLFGREARDDAIRRAATATLALTRAPAATPVLRRLWIEDGDERVRRIALEGLGASSEAVDLATLSGRSARPVGAALEGRLLLLAGRAGGPGAAAIIEKGARSRDAVVRTAAAASAFFHESPVSDRVLARLLADPSAVVQRTALAAQAARCARGGRSAEFWSLAAAKDDALRLLALQAEVYLRGRKVVRRLATLARDARHPEDVREEAGRFLELLKDDEPSARELARFRLQKALDDAGASPSWNVRASVNALVMELLGLDRVTFAVGGGTTPTGGNRSEAAPARRQSPEDEDLKLHLERHPYFDRAGTTLEMPPAPRR